MTTKNVKLTHNLTTEGKRKVCDIILFIGGPVDWRAWETWMGDIGYHGRGCVNEVNWGTDMIFVTSSTSGASVKYFWI